jgi:hypothetical protein
MDVIRRKTKPPVRHDWTNTGSFVSRPTQGWLHPDEQLAPDSGICYGLRVCLDHYALLDVDYLLFLIGLLTFDWRLIPDHCMF